MKTALISDLYLMRGHSRFYLGFCILLTFVAIVQGSAYSAFFFSGFLATFTPFIFFSAEEKLGWETVLLSAPISRCQMVRARYMLSLCLNVLFLLFGLLVGWCIQAEMLDFMLPISLFLVLLFSSVFLYTLYRWGTNRTQFIFFLFYAFFALTVRVLRPNASMLVGTPATMLGLSGFVLFFLSYRLSRRVYMHKEF